MAQSQLHSLEAPAVSGANSIVVIKRDYDLTVAAFRIDQTCRHPMLSVNVRSDMGSVAVNGYSVVRDRVVRCPVHRWHTQVPPTE